jgi:XTP/dITP diphosphohydrolase
MDDAAVASFRALNEVVERLRAPGGCPWDRAQTHASLRPYLLEETYEVLEAIDEGAAGRELREELGDVLLQVLMHCAIAAEEQDGFDVGDVAETSRAKMIHRHPHVFGEVTVDGAAEVVVNWERLKRSEKNERLSILEGIPKGLPALALAQGVQKRPARLGFDETPTSADALAMLRAAFERLASAAQPEPSQPQRGEDWTVTEGEIGQAPGEASNAGTTERDPAPAAPAALEDAVGELLFAAVALSRRLRVNPEDALRARTDSFAARFRLLEQRARADGVDLHDLDAAEWLRRWEEAVSAPR